MRDQEWWHGDTAEVMCSDGRWRVATYDTASSSPIWVFDDGLFRLAKHCNVRGRESGPTDAEVQAAIDSIMEVRS